MAKDEGMKIYLAARYSRRAELLEYSGELREAGHEVTSRWLDGRHELLGREARYNNEGGSPMVAQPFALEDYADVSAADIVVSFTEAPGSGAARGGRHVEFGMALAWGKTVSDCRPARERLSHLATGRSV